MPDFFAGNRIGATEQVRASTQGEFVSSSPRSAIASLEGGGYVVIYEGGPLQARIYDSNGEAVGEPIALPGTVVPDVVGLPGGGFAVTWINANRVEAQLFDAQGVATTSVFSVGSSTLPQSDPDVTVLENGNIVFVWSLNPTSAGIRSSIRAQVFNASGQAESDEPDSRPEFHAKFVPSRGHDTFRRRFRRRLGQWYAGCLQGYTCAGIHLYRDAARWVSDSARAG
ncbi:MAG: hypothetical protein HC774_02685 [Sphingomonadales bacterium]|nr:hypothetical protein [Sphingomonadales bacterium]